MSTLDDILDVAGKQRGYVATYQIDVSRQMFSHFAGQGRLERLRRGIYRVAHFPTYGHEELIVAYLWSRQRGVLSDATALALHDLSDVLPAAVDVCYPPDVHLPKGQPDWMTLHRRDIPEEDRQWYDIVPVTTPARTILDIAQRDLSPKFCLQALDEAKARQLVPPSFERKLLRELIAKTVTS